MSTATPHTQLSLISFMALCLQALQPILHAQQPTEAERAAARDRDRASAAAYRAAEVHIATTALRRTPTPEVIIAARTVAQLAREGLDRPKTTPDGREIIYLEPIANENVLRNTSEAVLRSGARLRRRLESGEDFDVRKEWEMIVVEELGEELRDELGSTRAGRVVGAGWDTIMRLTKQEHTYLDTPGDFGALSPGSAHLRRMAADSQTLLSRQARDLFRATGRSITVREVFDWLYPGGVIVAEDIPPLGSGLDRPFPDLYGGRHPAMSSIISELIQGNTQFNFPDDEFIEFRAGANDFAALSAALIAANADWYTPEGFGKWILDNSSKAGALVRDSDGKSATRELAAKACAESGRNGHQLQESEKNLSEIDKKLAELLASNDEAATRRREQELLEEQRAREEAIVRERLDFYNSMTIFLRSLPIRDPHRRQEIELLARSVEFAGRLDYLRMQNRISALGKTGLALDYVSLGLSLCNLFSGPETDLDGVIIEMLRDHSAAMHARLDSIDERLISIQRQLASQFRAIDQQLKYIADGQRDARIQLRGIKIELIELRSAVERYAERSRLTEREAIFVEFGRHFSKFVRSPIAYGEPLNEAGVREALDAFLGHICVDARRGPIIGELQSDFYSVPFQTAKQQKDLISEVVLRYSHTERRDLLRRLIDRLPNNSRELPAAEEAEKEAAASYRIPDTEYLRDAMEAYFTVWERSKAIESYSPPISDLPDLEQELKSLRSELLDGRALWRFQRIIDSRNSAFLTCVDDLSRLWPAFCERETFGWSDNLRYVERDLKAREELEELPDSKLIQELSKEPHSVMTMIGTYPIVRVPNETKKHVRMVIDDVITEYEGAPPYFVELLSPRIKDWIRLRIRHNLPIALKFHVAIYFHFADSSKVSRETLFLDTSLSGKVTCEVVPLNYGPHGGRVTEAEPYQVEVKMHDSRRVTIYVLDRVESRALPLKNAKVALRLARGPIAARADPRPGETDGMSSRFEIDAASIPDEFQNTNDLRGDIVLDLDPKTQIIGRLTHSISAGTVVFPTCMMRATAFGWTRFKDEVAADVNGLLEKDVSSGTFKGLVAGVNNAVGRPGPARRVPAKDYHDGIWGHMNAAKREAKKTNREEVRDGGVVAKWVLRDVLVARSKFLGHVERIAFGDHSLIQELQGKDMRYASLVETTMMNLELFDAFDVLLTAYVRSFAPEFFEGPANAHVLRQGLPGWQEVLDAAHRSNRSGQVWATELEHLRKFAPLHATQRTALLAWLADERNGANSLQWIDDELERVKNATKRLPR